MPTTVHSPIPADFRVVTDLRHALAAQKGTYLGVAARAPFEAQKSAVPAADCTFTQGSAGGVSGWWCHPAERRPGSALIYFHGGWFMLGTAEAFRHQASHYAARTRTSTFVPDYRRAPEAPFPAAFDDALATVRGMIAHGDPRIALVGDSVGGALVLSVLSAAGREQTGVRPVGGVAVSPVTDLTLSGASMTSRADADPIFTRTMVRHFVDVYLAGADPADQRASPLFGPLRNLPPIRIDVGDDEILLDDAVRYAERAIAEGVEVDLNIWSGMPHTFPGLVGKLGAADAAIEAECAFLSRLLEQAEP